MVGAGPPREFTFGFISNHKKITWKKYIFQVAKCNLYLLLLEPRIQIVKSVVSVPMQVKLSYNSTQKTLSHQFCPTELPLVTKHQIVVHFYFSHCSYKQNTSAGQTYIGKMGERDLSAIEFQAILDKNSIFKRIYLFFFFTEG